MTIGHHSLDLLKQLELASLRLLGLALLSDHVPLSNIILIARNVEIVDTSWRDHSILRLLFVAVISLRVTLAPSPQKEMALRKADAASKYPALFLQVSSGHNRITF